MAYKVIFRKGGVTVHQEVIHLPLEEAKIRALRILAKRGGDTAVLKEQGAHSEYLVER